jgi:hypothetical protein
MTQAKSTGDFGSSGRLGRLGEDLARILETPRGTGADADLQFGTDMLMPGEIDHDERLHDLLRVLQDYVAEKLGDPEEHLACLREKLSRVNALGV